MKNLIYKLFLKLFHDRLETMRLDYYSNRRRDEDRRSIVINYPIGTKVISQSNEPSGLIIGSVIGHVQSGWSDIVKIKTEKGKELLILGTLAYYTKSREKALRKLDWAERYNVMSQYWGLSEIDKKLKERPSYLKRPLTKDDMGELRSARKRAK